MEQPSNVEAKLFHPDRAMIDLNHSAIVYDGECVYCQNYVKLLKLKETIGPLELLNAREPDPRIKVLWDLGYDLNEGMIFIFAGRIHYGSDAVNVLATLSSRSTIANRINRFMFKRAWTASALYPMLKVGRRLTLLARGKEQLRRR